MNAGKAVTFLKYFGGKHYLAKDIVALLPEHRMYVEAFAGGASVLLSKQPCEFEVYNDRNGEIFNLFRVLRDQPEELQRALQLTPYSKNEFDFARLPLFDDSPVERARKMVVRFRQSHGGQGRSWSRSTTRIRGGVADVVSGSLTAIDEVLPTVVERLRTVQIENRDAIKLIETYSRPRTDPKASACIAENDRVFYCDPPYHPDTRATDDVYDFEMSTEDHKLLAKANLKCAAAGCKLILSGYDCADYANWYKDWRKVEIEKKNHAAGGKSKRTMTECLWLSWPGLAQE